MYKFVITLRYIRRRLITWFSIIGIAIGVTVLIVVLSVMDGFRKEFTSRLQGTLSDIVITVYDSKPVYQELEEKILSVPNVRGSAPHLRGLVLYGSGQNYAGGALIGIDYQRERKVGKLSDYLITAYKEHKIWAEETLENNIKEAYRISFSWKVLDVRDVEIQGYTERATRILCAELQEYIPNRKEMEYQFHVVFHAFIVKDEKIILMEKNIPLDKVTPALFRSGDIITSHFVDRMRDSSDEVSQYISRKLSPHAQRLFIKQSMTPMEASTLLSELNWLLIGESLYQKQVFQHVQLKPETQALLAKNPKGIEVIQLNRLLLEDAYADEIMYYNCLRKDRVDFDDLLYELQDPESTVSQYLQKHFSPILQNHWQDYNEAKSKYDKEPSKTDLFKNAELKRRVLQYALWSELIYWIYGQTYLLTMDIQYRETIQKAVIPEELRHGLAKANCILSNTSVLETERLNRKWILHDRENQREYFIINRGSLLVVYSKNNNSIYDQKIFKDVKLSTRSRRLLEKNFQELSQAQIVLLNSSLLADAYPKTIDMTCTVPDVHSSYVEQSPKWQEYFNRLATFFNQRNVVKYLEYFAQNLYYVSLQKPYLFQVDAKYEMSLEQGIVDEALGGIFRKYQIPLSSKAVVEVKEKGNKWQINDVKQYTISKGDTFLSVYGPVHLATIEANIVADWKQGKITEDVANLLAKHKIFVSPNTTIEMRESNGWIIDDIDRKRKYFLTDSNSDRSILDISITAASLCPSTGVVEYFLAETKSLDIDKPFDGFPKEDAKRDIIRPILLGSELMELLRVHRGQVIAALTGKRKPVNDKDTENGSFQENLEPVSKKFVVVGGFKSGWQEIDRQMAYARIEDLMEKDREFFDVSGDVNEICVALEDFKKVDETKENLDSKLNPSFSRDYKKYRVERWEDQRKSLLAAIRLERSVMTIILSLIIALAVVTIMIILVLLVKEKTKDIGILKSMGATDLGIMSIFMFNGVCISLFGSMIGTGLGIWISLKINWLADNIYEFTGFRVFPKDVYYLDKIPTELSLLNIGVIISATLGLSLLACTIPALKAARMDVVEALSSESPSLKLWRRKRRKPLVTTTTPEAFYGAKELGKEYIIGHSTLRILKSVSLEIQQGEILVIVGSSGAGKSTLLHLMGLLDTPTNGMVFLKGINLNNFSYRDQAKVRSKSIGFIFQFYHLLPEFTAMENVLLGAMIRYGIMEWPSKRTVCLEKAKNLLRNVGLEDRMGHLPNELSGGERQRVAIARALINDPQIVLCDEPTGNLDEENSQSIQKILWELNEQLKQTFIIVTHEESIARKGHRVFKLEHGQLRQIS